MTGKNDNWGHALKSGEVHVEDTPWAVRVYSDGKIIARFKTQAEAHEYGNRWSFSVVFNTTPPPSVREIVADLPIGTVFRLTMPGVGHGDKRVVVGPGGMYVESPLAGHVTVHVYSPNGISMKATVEVVK